MACCAHCYQKYINADGTTDYVRFAVELSKETKRAVDPVELEEADGKGIIRYCKCDCHKDGENLLH